MFKTALKFGLLALLALILVQLGKYSLLFSSWSSELSISLVALFFLLIGALLARQGKLDHLNPATRKLTAPARPTTDLQSISKRELEVLQEMDKGLSNKEIAHSLFISESTVKTHVSNLLIKLDAKRRTEALKKAREQGLLH
ncbi:MAG TPA: response regulator transcription factor [Saprospiraceae bacterium]|nr:response regulator transcription factor [Saprospiraceae bacterium]HMQ85450.1 response regulator transcription factor [Saprospiraceae bacterium]